MLGLAVPLLSGIPLPATGVPVPPLKGRQLGLSKIVILASIFWRPSMAPVGALFADDWRRLTQSCCVPKRLASVRSSSARPPPQP
eukprot:3500522-Pyramimonas_sp.AAC.1